MAFEGPQPSWGNSLFQTCQRQAGDNVTGKSGYIPGPFLPNPVTSRLEHSDVSWSQECHDDQYKLRYDQTAFKNRKPTDASCDGEADLQGLVSNILEEVDSRDSFYSESLPTSNHIWSSKGLNEELLQYFQPVPKTFNNSSFIPNHLARETFSKAYQPGDKEVNELSPLYNGPAENQQWAFNLPNGGGYSVRPQKLPPGLPLSNRVTGDPSQTQKYKHTSMPPYNSSGNDAASKNVPVLGDIFRARKDANTLCLADFCDDQYHPKSVNPFLNERCVPEDMNQLVSGFRSFMPSDHGSSWYGDLANVHKAQMDMFQEDGLTQLCREIKDPAVSAQSFPAAHTRKELFGDVEMMQNGRIGEVRKQNLKLDNFHDPPDFSSGHMEYFQKPTPFPTNMHFQNQHPKKMITHVENNNLSTNQYSKHYARQTQRKIKPQMEKENKVIQMSGFTYMAEAEKQRLAQNPYFDFVGNTQSHKRDREGMINNGKVQQFTALPYSLNDLRRNPSMTMNSNLGSRSILPCDNRGPSMDVTGTGSANDAAALSAYIRDMKSRRGESTYHGMASALTAPLVMHQEGPTFQLHLYLDECYEQFRSLEKERKKAEVILKKAFPGKRAAMMTNINSPKTPPRTTRVDYLVVNQMKEQAKVASLFDRMECISGVPLHVNIHAALKTHHMAVCITQSRRKEDNGNAKRQQQGINLGEDRDNPLMVMALRELAATTKRLRTVLWCALQTTLPKPIEIQDLDIYEKAPSAEERSSPFQGYSFCL